MFPLEPGAHEATDRTLAALFAALFLTRCQSRKAKRVACYLTISIQILEVHVPVVEGVTPTHQVEDHLRVVQTRTLFSADRLATISPKSRIAASMQGRPRNTILPTNS
uniref:(northern house mosquito) hypothetical protein n=1 Tax=Culex pipiens TaxID=7175 RepID=A0A8D8CBB1_CULPI